MEFISKIFGKEKLMAKNGSSVGNFCSPQLSGRR
jgi:hypothetical protein